MKEFSQEAEQVMIERFGKDTIISLATCLLYTSCDQRIL